MNGRLIQDRRRVKGRGALSNSTPRFEALSHVEFDDGWEGLGELEKFKTEVRAENAKSIITSNKSPDIPFDTSVNPYRGCEHGCIYCYARPTHAYWGLSPGIDFETKLTARVNAPELLRTEIAKANYRPRPLAFGTNTDPYQPIERGLKLTRRIIEVLSETNHPLTIVTKSALVIRDLDLLQPMAEKGLLKVAISVTTLDGKLARRMEPRASQPEKRLDALGELSEAGVPTMVMVAPLIPGLTDHEMERILELSANAGVKETGYVLLRLPLEIKDLFNDWLVEEFPNKAKRVFSLIKSMRGGKAYEARFGKRMRGEGPFAELIAQRFELAARRLKLNTERMPLREDLFEAPQLPGTQMSLL